MTTQPNIFLAHASEDKDAVRELHARLVELGFRPWLDEIDLIPGQNWRIEIPKAIKDSDVFLACLSKCSVRKQGYVQKEFRLALDTYAEKPPGSIYVIPVKLDDCEMPDLQLPQLGVSLQDIQWLDLWKQDGFDRLISALEHALGKGGPKAVPRGEPKTLPPANLGGLELSAGSAFALIDLESGGSRNIRDLHVINKLSDKTFDDVVIELRLPAGIAFAKAVPSAGEKPEFGHVTLRLSRPIHPGASLEIGYVKKHFDFENPVARMFGSTASNEALEWNITGRDTPATSGTVDVSWLQGDEDED